MSFFGKTVICSDRLLWYIKLGALFHCFRTRSCTGEVHVSSKHSNYGEDPVTDRKSEENLEENVK